MVTQKASMSTERERERERGRHCKFLSYLTGARYVLSAVSVLVGTQLSSEVPEGLMNYHIYIYTYTYMWGVGEREKARERERERECYSGNGTVQGCNQPY
jgi:hypothetical protein